MKNILSEIVVAGSGNGLVNNLLHLLIIGVCLAIVYALGVWAISAFAVSAMVRKIWDGLFIFIIAIVAINFLLSLSGRGFITW